MLGKGRRKRRKTKEAIMVLYSRAPARVWFAQGKGKVSMA